MPSKTSNKARISAAPSLATLPPKAGGVRLRPKRTATPVFEEWKNHFPFGIMLDASGATADMKNMLSPATTSTLDATNPTGFSTMITHPESGLIANHLNYIMWTNGSYVQDDVNALSDIVEAVPRNMWQVVAPYLQFDNEWFTNEGISHTDAEADALVAPVTAFYSTHPSVLAYINHDDVTTLNTSAARSAPISRALQRADAFGRPASGVYIAGVDYEQHFPEIDLLVWYYYPCGRYPNNTITTEGDLHRDSQGSTGDFETAPTNTVAGLPAGARTWMITQAHETTGDDASTIRYPYPSEFRMITWIAVGAGVKGIFWFAGTDQSPNWEGLLNNSAASRARMAVVSEMSTRLTPEIRQRLLTAEQSVAKFATSGGGNASYPTPYANAYVGTLYDATSDVYYCVVCNHATSAAAVTISSATLYGTLVNMETGARLPLGGSVTLPRLDGTIYWLDRTPGPPKRIINESVNVETLWANDWANPDALGYLSRDAIVLHPNVVTVISGDNLQAKIDAAPDYTTFSIGPGTYGFVELHQRAHLHFVATDPGNKPVLRGFKKVYGSIYSEYTNPQSTPTPGFVWHLYTLKTDKAFWDALHPAEDFIFRDLIFTSDGSLCVYEYFLQDGSQNHDHWVSNMPFWFRNVRGVLIEDCEFMAGYFVGNDPGPPPAVSTYTGTPGYADVGYISGNSGPDQITVRNCILHGNGQIPMGIFLDGSMGSVIYNNTLDGYWQSGAITFFTNDDFGIDYNDDGIFSFDRDNGNANRNIAVGNQIALAATAVIILQAHDCLIAENELITDYGATTLPWFALLASRASSRYSALASPMAYLHINNIFRDNILNCPVTRFLTYQADNNVPGISVVGQSTITGNDARGYTVGSWVGDWDESFATSIGGDTVSGNLTGGEPRPPDLVGDVFATDPFTDTDSELLHNHISADGLFWYRHPDTNAFSCAITTNRLRFNEASGESIYWPNADPIDANYTVEADIIMLSDNNASEAGVCGRVKITATVNLYLARYMTNGNVWQLYKNVAGTYTQLGSNVGQTLTIGQAYRLKLSMNGTAIKVYVSGAEIISVTDSAITAAGRPGVRFAGPVTTSTGLVMDNFTVTNIVGGEPAGVWVDLGQNSTINAVATPDGRRIGALTEWNGRIYLGYGDYDLNAPEAIEILSWDTVAQSYATSLGTLNANANFDWRVIDDELWCVANDMGSGSHGHYGVVTAAHGYTDMNPGPGDIPAWHLFDMAWFGGAAFIAGASYEAADCSFATVWRHNGSVWSVVNEIGTCPVVERTYGLFVIGSTLYAASANQQVRYTTNGTSWSTGSGLSTLYVTHPLSVTGAAIYKTQHSPSGSATALKRFDGTTETTPIASGVKAHCLAPDGIPWVLVGQEIREGNAGGTSFAMVLDDAPSNGTALCVTADAFFVGTADSHLWRIDR